jgi:hypothetical protein
MKEVVKHGEYSYQNSFWRMIQSFTDAFMELPEEAMPRAVKLAQECS